MITLLSCSKPPEGLPCDRNDTTEFGNSAEAKPLYPYLRKAIPWASLEDPAPIAQRLLFMDTVYWYVAMYGHTGNPDFTHVFDMNGDGVDDYVYSGPGPGFDTREMITVFKINNTVLSTAGMLKALDFDRGILRRLYLECSLETNSPHVSQQTSYEIDYPDGKPTLRKFFQSEMLDTTELPPSLYKKYHTRTFCDDSIILRSSPQTASAAFSRRPNPTQGLVLGEKIDAHKNKWLFIAIARVPEAADSSERTYQVGWTQDASTH